MIEDCITKLENSTIKKFPFDLFIACGESFEKLSQITSTLLHADVPLKDAQDNLIETLNRFEKIHFIACYIGAIRRHSQILGLSLAQSWMLIDPEHTLDRQIREIMLFSSMVKECNSSEEFSLISPYLPLLASLSSILSQVENPNERNAYAGYLYESFTRLNDLQPNKGWDVAAFSLLKAKPETKAVVDDIEMMSYSPR